MRKSVEEESAIIRQQEASGQSAAEYCRQHGLSEKRFQAWRQRAKSRGCFVAEVVGDLRVAYESRSASRIKKASRFSVTVTGALLYFNFQLI